MLFVLSAIVSILLGISVVSGHMKSGEMSGCSGGCLVFFLFIIMVIVILAVVFVAIISL